MISDHDKALRRRSTYCGDSGDCVEAVDDTLGVIPVHDSKTPHSPSLRVAKRAWARFMSAIEAGAISAVK
ncbi:DUF397 domain-containing protein [Streptomyces sp. UNOC14_S4]|uniref:DUF397 domain-containing protein n=1 Tax=Streptomyces sp. UNOC14_S4 TaxID=2872340 RepID=UPI001E491E0E|nr:DUF397 domain-containing protein [Streptomyces sp. UNOC14_S4]MCC3771955.1 DUF397 domain-containing protein [Streptomyces sp. UNOC14_S4]